MQKKSKKFESKMTEVPKANVKTMLKARQFEDSESHAKFDYKIAL